MVLSLLDRPRKRGLPHPHRPRGCELRVHGGCQRGGSPARPWEIKERGLELGSAGIDDETSSHVALVAGRRWGYQKQVFG